MRVSGPAVPALALRVAGRVVPERQAVLVRLTDEVGEELDEVLLLRFAAPRSFTGEHVLEFHLHGGRAVVRAVSDWLGREAGLRLAEPGEFTLRAFRNDRIDLVEAERLGDLIHADTEAQRRFATSGTGRRNAARYEEWRSTLVQARALLEASLDFADEDDAPADVTDEVQALLRQTEAALETHIAGAANAEIVRDGLRVVLLGAPNAGKSSLLNALADRDAAIVSSVPGTTRDAIEVVLDCEGYRVVLTDTAGLREAEDEVEAMGIERTGRTAAEADLVLLLHPVDATEPPPPTPSSAAPVVQIRTKSDLKDASQQEYCGLRVSSWTRHGIDRVVACLAAHARANEPAEDVPVAERHVSHLRCAMDQLRSARTHSRPELMAEHIGEAAKELGRITGRTDIEHVYDAIFSKFCMGK